MYKLSYVLTEPVIVQQPQNATVMVHKSHEFVCKVRGNPKPKVQWQYQGYDLDRRGSNYRFIQKTGSLKFDTLSLLDSGEYTCIAKNSKGTTKSDTVYLNVEGKYFVSGMSM